MLTPKQEKYVHNLVKGMSQREAYKKSYNASKMKDETIDKRASELFKNREIKGRYEELIKKTDDEAIMSAIERKKWLTKVVLGKTEEKIVLEFKKDDNGQIIKEEQNVPANLKTRITALDILNKMDSLYTVPIKGDVTLSYENALKKVSDDNEY